MDTHLAGSADRDKNDSFLPVLRVGFGGRRGGWIGGIFGDFDVGDVGFNLHAIRVSLVKTALNDASLFIFETGGAVLIAFGWLELGPQRLRTSGAITI